MEKNTSVSESSLTVGGDGRAPILFLLLNVREFLHQLVSGTSATLITCPSIKKIEIFLSLYYDLEKEECFNLLCKP